MAIDLESPPGLSMTGLVKDIIDDAQELIRQQLQLFRQEIRADIRKAREAAMFLAIGVGITAIGGLLLLLMLPLLLNSLVPTIPLWGCYGIIGGVAAAIGAGLLFAGVKQIESVTPLSDQSAVALKENLQWMTPPK
jgi:hypothetical protein